MVAREAGCRKARHVSISANSTSLAGRMVFSWGLGKGCWQRRPGYRLRARIAGKSGLRHAFGMAGAVRGLCPFRHRGVVPNDRAAGPHSHQRGPRIAQDRFHAQRYITPLDRWTSSIRLILGSNRTVRAIAVRSMKPEKASRAEQPLQTPHPASLTYVQRQAAPPLHGNEHQRPRLR